MPIKSLLHIRDDVVSNRSKDNAMGVCREPLEQKDQDNCEGNYPDPVRIVFDNHIIDNRLHHPCRGRRRQRDNDHEKERQHIAGQILPSVLAKQPLD